MTKQVIQLRACINSHCLATSSSGRFLTHEAAPIDRFISPYQGNMLHYRLGWGWYVIAISHHIEYIIWNDSPLGTIIQPAPFSNVQRRDKSLLESWTTGGATNLWTVTSMVRESSRLYYVLVCGRHYIRHHNPCPPRFSPAPARLPRAGSAFVLVQCYGGLTDVFLIQMTGLTWEKCMDIIKHFEPNPESRRNGQLMIDGEYTGSPPPPPHTHFPNGMRDQLDVRRALACDEFEVWLRYRWYTAQGLARFRGVWGSISGAVRQSWHR